MKNKKFQKRVEDFKCDNCGKVVKGNGYTNHCPKCLCSKHVDINPGDRENKCMGLMKPVDTFLKNGEWVLIQKCEECGEEKNIKVREKDNKEKLEDIIKKMLRNF